MSVQRETYYRIGSSVWHEFTTDDTRLMALYVLTCRHRTTEGLFLLPMGYASADLDWPEKRVRKALDAILDNGLARYDEKARVCFIVQALKWQSPGSELQVRGAITRLLPLPPTPLLAELHEQAQQFAQRLAQEMTQHFPQLAA